MAYAFGELLFQLITGAGYNITSFAKAAGTGKSTISQTISGVARPPSDDKIAKWAKILQISKSQRDELIALAGPARVRGKKDSIKYVEQIEETNQEMGELLSRLSELLLQYGVDLPKDVNEKLSSLKRRV